MVDLLIDILVWIVIISGWLYIGTKVFSLSWFMNSLYYDKLRLSIIKEGWFYDAIIVMILLIILSLWPIFVIHEIIEMISKKKQ